MFNWTLLTVAAFVIAALYHRVKAWDEQQERQPRPFGQPLR